MEHFLKKIKASSDPPQMDISDGDLTCRVTIALSPKPVEFNLHKSGDAEARTALRDLVFLLAERSKDQQKQLEKATSVIENLQQAKHPTDRTPMFDLNDAKSLKTSTKAATKQPGMSVINPGSKKKKLATGVEFD